MGMKKLYILHGWSVDKNNEDKWIDFRAELKALGIESEFLGLPGLTTTLDQEWHLDDYVNWLDDQLKGRKDIILLGHSFGGQLAVRYNRTHQGQIKKLVLIDSAGIVDRSVKMKVKRLVFGILAKFGKIFFRAKFFRKILYRLTREKDYYNAPPIQRRTMTNVINEEIIADLSEVSSPTLIVWGSDDKVTPLKNSLVFTENISSGKLEVIDGARHAPHFTHPHKVAQVVAEFVS